MVLRRQQLYIFICLALVLWSMSAMAIESKRILIIHAYSQEYPWTKGQHIGFVEGLSQQLSTPLLIETEYLDTKRIQFDAHYRALFRDYLQQKYRGFEPDALYVTDDDGLDFGLHELKALYPQTALFFSGVNDYGVQRQLDPQWQTGVFEKKASIPNLKLLDELLGPTGSVRVVGDASNTYRSIEHELRQELTREQAGQLDFIAHERMEDLLKALSVHPNQPLLLTTLGALKDEAGQAIPLDQVIAAIVEVTQGVILSMEDAYLYPGVLGGYVTSGPAQGSAAAELMAAFLAGTPMAELGPRLDSPNEYLVNDQVLLKLKIDLPARLKGRVRLLYPRRSFYQQHANKIIAVTALLAFLFLLTLIFYALRVTRTNRELRMKSEQLVRQGRQLEESEEKYRLLFEKSEDPMLVLRDGVFAMANDAASRMLGYGDTKGFSRLHPAVISPTSQPDGMDSADKAQLLMDRAFGEGYQRFEWVHLKRDGSELLVEVSLTRIPYEGADALLCVWRDISNWRKTEEALREKTIYLDSVLGASINVGFIATDLVLNINYFNDTAARIFGLEPKELEGKDIFFFHGGLNSVPNQRVDAALKVARDVGEYRFSLKQNLGSEPRYIDARISPIKDEAGILIGYMLMAEDVSKQHEAEELIKFQAAYDALTNLPNRRTLMERLGQDLANCRRHGHYGALFFLDLDNFKNINDTLGHPMGDRLLQQVAERMRLSMRNEDTIARLGGDEFVVLIAEMGDELGQALNDIQVVAENLLTSLNAPYLIDGRDIRAGCSIGITLFPTPEDSADDILRQADTAMYQAKEAGRNTFKFFSPAMQQQAELRMQLLNDLHEAVEQQAFETYFQPQMDAEGHLLGAEALVRWFHKERGFISPEDFIPLAEEAGLIQRLSEQVLRETLRLQRRWIDQWQGARRLQLAVNVSALQFDQAKFSDWVITILEQEGADPTQLTFELTESMLLGDVSETAAKMHRLKELGARFSIDDFGTGYSSLAYLKRLPIDEIKVDRSFVQDILDDPSDAALVSTIITLAERLNLEVVAEGVESEAIWAMLKQQGCPIFQGYHFSKPLSSDDFEAKYFQ